MKRRLRSVVLGIVLAASVVVLATGCGGAQNTGGGGKPIVLGLSDWPGWLPWYIAQEKGFFKEEGVPVELRWFPVYTDSLQALAAGKVDANSQTLGDTLAPLSKGVDLRVVLVNDNSAGNDAVVARDGIGSIQDLRGKKVAAELGTVDHMLLLQALQRAGMTQKDIQFTPMNTVDAPAAMLSGNIDAAAVWEPSKSKILSEVKGSRVLFDSSQTPGLIPDLLVAQGELVEKRPEDVQKLVNAWFKALAWYRQHPDEGIAIMAKQVSVPPEEYKAFVGGTRLFSASDNVTAMQTGQTPESLFFTAGELGKFLKEQKMLDKVPGQEQMNKAIDPRFVLAAEAKGLGASTAIPATTQGR